MDLFYIRNKFSILSAEEIINNNKLSECIAYIVDNDIDGYYENLKNDMDEKKWKFISLAPFKSKANINTIKLVFLKNNINRIENIILETLRMMNIKRVFLSNILAYEEKIIYYCAKMMDIEVNYYEEGTNLYLNNGKECSKIKYFSKKILLGKYKYLCYDRKLFNFNSVYCCFPEKYLLNNVKEKKRNIIKLIDDSKKIDRQQGIDVLFLSRPLSEDKIISLEDEINLFMNLKNKFKNKNIYVKFHPRESKEKISYFKEKYDISELPEKYCDMPAEKLLMYININILVGYETGTLAYVSEITNIKTYSMLRLVNNKSKYLNDFYEFYKSYFKNINYL